MEEGGVSNLNSISEFVKGGKFKCAGPAVSKWVIFRCQYLKRSVFANSSCFQINRASVLDPCVGDRGAFEAITRGAHSFRYGIEQMPNVRQLRELIAP